MTTTDQQFLDKYQQIIAEEVNVKEVGLLPIDMQVSKTYVPLGKELSSSFGKDTGQIIAAAKQGNVEELEGGDIKVSNNGQDRILNDTQYDIRYSGLEGNNQIVEEGIIVELNLTITDELQAEGVAREISRFLNQMRKEADYQVNDRVACYFSTDNDYFQNIITKFTSFLQTEALLTTVTSETNEGDITSEFASEEGKITFTLKL